MKLKFLDNVHVHEKRTEALCHTLYYAFHGCYFVRLIDLLRSV